MRARPARWKASPHSAIFLRIYARTVSCHPPAASCRKGFCVCSVPHARREHRRTAPARLRLLPVPAHTRHAKRANAARARAASPQFHRPVLVLSPSEDIIHARPVIFRKANQRPDGNLALSFSYRRYTSRLQCRISAICCCVLSWSTRRSSNLRKYIFCHLMYMLLFCGIIREYTLPFSGTVPVFPFLPTLYIPVRPHDARFR